MSSTSGNKRGFNSLNRRCAFADDFRQINARECGANRIFTPTKLERNASTSSARKADYRA